MKKRLIFPMALVMVGFVLLVGCFYVPTFEHPKPGNQKDFRKLVGTKEGLPIRPGFVDRQAVLKLLGAPPLASADGKLIGYLYETQHGVWVYPLCFGAVWANNRIYVLRLDFGDNDVLRQFKIASEETPNGPLSDDVSFPIAAAVADLDEPNSPLLWHGTRPVKFDLGYDLIATTKPVTQP